MGATRIQPSLMVFWLSSRRTCQWGRRGPALEPDHLPTSPTQVMLSPGLQQPSPKDQALAANHSPGWETHCAWESGLRLSENAMKICGSLNCIGFWNWIQTAIGKCSESTFIPEWASFDCSRFSIGTIWSGVVIIYVCFLKSGTK